MCIQCTCISQKKKEKKCLHKHNCTPRPPRFHLLCEMYINQDVEANKSIIIPIPRTSWWSIAIDLYSETVSELSTKKLSDTSRRRLCKGKDNKQMLIKREKTEMTQTHCLCLCARFHLAQAIQISVLYVTARRYSETEYRWVVRYGNNVFDLCLPPLASNNILSVCKVGFQAMVTSEWSSAHVMMQIGCTCLDGSNPTYKIVRKCPLHKRGSL